MCCPASSYVHWVDSNVATKSWYPGGFTQRCRTGTLSSQSCVRFTKLGGRVSTELLCASSNIFSARKLPKFGGNSEKWLAIAHSSTRLVSLVIESGNNTRFEAVKSSTSRLTRLPICCGRSKSKVLQKQRTFRCINVHKLSSMICISTSMLVTASLFAYRCVKLVMPLKSMSMSSNQLSEMSRKRKLTRSDMFSGIYTCRRKTNVNRPDTRQQQKNQQSSCKHRQQYAGARRCATCDR